MATLFGNEAGLTWWCHTSCNFQKWRGNFWGAYSLVCFMFCEIEWPTLWKLSSTSTLLLSQQYSPQEEKRNPVLTDPPTLLHSLNLSLSSSFVEMLSEILLSPLPNCNPEDTCLEGWALANESSPENVYSFLPFHMCFFPLTCNKREKPSWYHVCNYLMDEASPLT